MPDTNNKKPTSKNGHDDLDVASPPADLLQQVQADVSRAGGELPEDANRTGAIGATMFDMAGSEDNTLTVLLPREHAQKAPSQALVRIKSSDDRRYLGLVTAGPFAEPDTLRADSRLLVTVTSQGGIYLPPYHGRVQVSILGQELDDGSLVPPRLRPLPNSPVIVLGDEESAQVLHCTGDLRLGLVVGHSNAVMGIPADKKNVLPRHTAILGTTGAGKSNTVATFVQQAIREGFAVIVLDVEGEYSQLHEPADEPGMVATLRDRNIVPAGAPAQDVTLYHLVGRESSNPQHPNRRPFSLQFANLSPYAASEILNLTEPQQIRFFQAYDIAKELLRDLGIFPQQDKGAEERARQERMALELDEFERGYPRLTLSLLMDVVAACLHQADKGGKEASGSKKKSDDASATDSFTPFNEVLASGQGKTALWKRIHAARIHANAISWRALMGRLGRLNRLRVFDTPKAKPMVYKQLIESGVLSIIDLSDTGASELNNIVITDLLRGVQKEQQRAYRTYEKGESKHLPRVLLILEEAHEFLSSERIDKLNTLFEQVSRIAKRGRKRWFSLAFVTQLPQHLPRSVLGLCNNFILHKLSDPQVVNNLRRTIGGIDESLWNRLPGLAPGQAIVSFGHMMRPLLVSIDPAPCKLLMTD